MIKLCSNSKTRAELLKSANINFLQQGCEFDEDSIQIIEPIEFVKEATLGKFRECLKCFGDDIPLLVADTIITDGKHLIRKAKNREEAKKLLLLQSGAKIDIVTYQIITYKGDKFENLATTTYNFYPFNLEDLENYLDSEEWKGSAGACKVEGFCKKYIKNVNGYESTAMGLTIEWVKEVLENLSLEKS